jgi:hypothetical protein
MPAFRSPKKTWGQSAAPYKKGSFIPSQESLDGEADEEYRTRAKSDPYTHYILKTGKRRGKTLKQVVIARRGRFGLRPVDAHQSKGMQRLGR